MKHLLILPFITLSLVACSGPAAQDDFVENLMPLCGNSYAGQVVSTDAVDADWRRETIIAGPVACEVAAIKMPLAVGENTSRTWVIIPDKRTLTLKHDHRHDGKPDAVSWYGGKAVDAGTATRQEFPVDEFSIELFKKEGLDASVTNTWALEITPNESFAYELSRPPTGKQLAANESGRFFRLEFNLTNSIDSNIEPDTDFGFFWVGEMGSNASNISLPQRGQQSKIVELEIPAVIDKSCLRSLALGEHLSSDAHVVNFILTDVCAQRFGVETAQNIGRQFAVVVNGEILSLPRVNASVTGGQGFLEFGSEADAAAAFVKKINSQFISNP